jgi:predicted nucleic acid-binding protein
MMLLLDTSVVVDVLRQHQPTVRQYQLLDKGSLIISMITVVELTNAATSYAEQTSILRQLKKYPVLHITEEASHLAMPLYLRRKLSVGMEFNDALIAGQVLAADVPLLDTQHQALSRHSGLAAVARSGNLKRFVAHHEAAVRKLTP